MKIIKFLGTAAALSLGVGSAYASNEGAKPIPNVVAQDDPAHTKGPIPNVVAPPDAAESLQDGSITSARRRDRQLILLH